MKLLNNFSSTKASWIEHILRRNGLCHVLRKQELKEEAEDRQKWKLFVNRT